MRPILLAAILCVAPAQADKLAVPSAADQRKNEKTIRDLLKDAYQRKDQNSRRVLARTLLESAEKETQDWPMVFSFYKEAGDVAADGMDFALAVSAIEQLEKIFKVEPESPLTGATFSPRHEMRKQLFKRTQKSVQTPEDVSSYVKGALRLAELYFTEDSFDDCAHVAQMAEGVALGSGEQGLQTLVRGALRKYAALKHEHDKVSKAHLRILSDPNDAEAAQTWGIFLAFTVGDWARALPWIAKGRDGALKEICQRELDLGAPPAELADGWLGLAEKAKEPERGRYRVRARIWLERALESLLGVEKLKVERKLEELHKAMGITDLVRGVDPLKDFSSKGQGKGGRATLEGTKLLVEAGAFQTGLVEFPYIPPAEYTLTVEARHAGGEFRPFSVGLSDGTRQWVVTVGLNNPTLGAVPGVQNIDGKSLPMDEETKASASIPLGKVGSFIFTVRQGGFTVAVNGREVIDWSGDPKRLSAPDPMSVGRKNTIFLSVTSCRYEFQKAVIVPISGQGQKLR